MQLRSLILASVALFRRGLPPYLKLMLQRFEKLPQRVCTPCYVLKIHGVDKVCHMLSAA